MPKFLHRYLNRYAYTDKQISQIASARLGMVIVIPCHDEPDIITTLNSLLKCQQPNCAIEIIVVINASEQAETSVLIQNKQSYADIQAWVDQHTKMQVHVLELNALPKKHAGVGLARKLGMDEAIRRFVGIGQTKGVIVSLDADCTVHPQYLVDIYQCFQNDTSKACVIPFEHCTHDLNSQHLQAMVLYELEILYHLQGLKVAQYPHDFHTLGSCFAVSVQAYAAQGGMNRRQAGEDFYFLHKIAELGDIPTLKHSCVYPSARISYRVPFGTGQALQTWMQGKTATRMVASPTVYQDLAFLFSQLNVLYQQDIVLPQRLEQFLMKHDFTNTIVDMRTRVRSPATFRKRFLRWFHALRIRQYSNACACELHLEKAALELLAMQEIQAEQGLEALLRQYRQLNWYNTFVKK